MDTVRPGQIVYFSTLSNLTINVCLPLMCSKIIQLIEMTCCCVERMLCKASGEEWSGRMSGCGGGGGGVTGRGSCLLIVEPRFFSM